jgi:hypothetical protein
MPESADLMIYWHDAPRRRGDVVTIPTIWLALVLSLFVHIAALWEFLPKLPLAPGDAAEVGKVGERLAVRLAPAQTQLPSTPSPPAQGTPASPSQKAQPSSPKPRPQKATPPAAPTPPSVALAPPSVRERPALPMPAPSPAQPVAPPVAPPAPPSLPMEGDLSSFIAARRRARGDPEPSTSMGNASNAAPAESETARRDRIVAANLASNSTPTFGTEPKNSGGIFQLRRVGYDDAEFTFFGWNKDIRRRASQKIEVRKGNNSDIQIAVVRRIIEVIRDYEQEDFSWSSTRLGRVIILSARPTDNAGLEEFMMQEFFSAPKP